MVQNTKLAFVKFYLIFTIGMLMIAPAFGNDFSTGGNELVGTAPEGTFITDIFLIADLISRFTILLSLSSQNLLLGAFLSVMTLAFIWAIFEMVRGN